MQKVVFNRFYGGMTGDPSIGVDGGIYDGEGIDIRSDSKKVTMSLNYEGYSKLYNGTTLGNILGSIFYSNTNAVLMHEAGYISNPIFQASDYGCKYMNQANGAFRNILRVNNYGVIIAEGAVVRWNIDDNDYYLGIAGNNIVTNGDMSSSGSWTVGAGWAFTGGQAVHTPGSVADLYQSLTTVIGKRYTVIVKGLRTAGSLTVKYNGTTIQTLTTEINSNVISLSWIAVGTSDTINFVPSSDFDGYLDKVEVYESNTTLFTSGASFSGDCPVLTGPNVIYIGNGNKVTMVDTTTGTWTISTSVTIDSGFLIKGLTRVADQVYIYATDGSVTKRYYWDGVSTAVESSTTWYDKPVQRVISWNNFDYIVVANQFVSSLYVANGNQLELIVQGGNNTNNNQRIGFEASYINSIDTMRNVFLLPGSGDLYSYGFKHKGFGNSLIKDLSVDGTITSISFSEGASYNLYVFYTSSNNGTTCPYVATFYQNEFGNTIYRTTAPGTIVLPKVITGDTYSQEYTSVKLRVGYKLNHTNQAINILEKTDDGEKYCSLYIESYTTLPTVGAVYGAYTVVGVTHITGMTGYTLHCSYTGSYAQSSGNLSKTSGTGDSTIRIFRSLDKFKLVQTLTEDKKYQTFTHTGNWNDKQFAIEMYTGNASYTPEFKDLTFLYEPVKSDI